MAHLVVGQTPHRSEVANNALSYGRMERLVVSPPAAAEGVRTIVDSAGRRKVLISGTSPRSLSKALVSACGGRETCPLTITSSGWCWPKERKCRGGRRRKQTNNRSATVATFGPGSTWSAASVGRRRPRCSGRSSERTVERGDVGRWLLRAHGRAKPLSQ